MWGLSNAILLPFAILACPSRVSAGTPYNVWSKVGEEGEYHSQLVSVNHDELSTVLLENLAASGEVDLSFEFFSGDVVCTLRRSSVMHPKLAAKFPTVLALMGACDDEGTTVSLSMNAEIEGSFAATVHHKDGIMFFVDHDDDQSTDIDSFYVHVPRHSSEAYTDTVILPGEVRRKLAETTPVSSVFAPAWQDRELAASLEAYKFRLAVVTTETYSAYHGNTLAGVLTAIATALARVNGVVLRELGVMFELIEDNDLIICLGESDCTHLENNVNVLYQSKAFMDSRGVTADQYDIGHTFSTQGGGVAVVGALCWENYKQMGTSGYGSTPTGDNYYLLMSHEFGHQLSGGHTFRDCNGASDSNLSNSTAVEPGSGSSILSYPGICAGTGDDNNLQYVKDPYYNSGVLVSMREFIEGKVANGCGETVTMTGVVQPIMDTLDTCTVPKGNYVQLGGSISNAASITGNTYIAWDRVDPGYEDYTDLTVARFAPLTPSTRSMLRFLPNMYVLSFSPDQQYEIEPLNDGAGDKVMTFRFIGRTKYHPTNTVSSFDVDLAGTFGYHDLELTYDDSLTPLSLTSLPTALVGQDTETITWTGGTSADVEILVALNTMTEVASPDFDVDVQDLTWVSMGTFSNTGSASVTIPNLSNPSDLPMNLMIRSGDTDCYFFDLHAGIDYTPNTDPSAAPSVAPSMLPSQEPSSVPSSIPSSSPSETPTNVPSLSPSQSPTGTGSASPTESKQPTSAPSSAPSNVPSALPSLSPSQVPSLAPSNAPTGIPSESPSALPSQLPSTSPSSAPSDAPSNQPSAMPSPAPSARPSVSMEPTQAIQPSDVPSFSPSLAPTDKPSSSPSTTPSSTPTSSPSAAPSKSPTESPSASPTVSPTLSFVPTQSPTEGSNQVCAAISGNSCAYSKCSSSWDESEDEWRTSEVDSVTVCVRNRRSGELSSKCVTIDTLGDKVAGDRLGRHYEINNCGCCADETADEMGICRPNVCSVDDYGCGSYRSHHKDILKANLCIEYEGERSIVCANPYKDFPSGVSVVGCGSECVPFDGSPFPTASPSASPTKAPTSSPSASPTAAPSASPTKAPTSSTDAPTSSPTSASDGTCSSEADNVCQYIKDSNGDVVAGSHSMCLYDQRKRKSVTYCLPESRYGHLEPGDKINKRYSVQSCGCCSNDNNRNYCRGETDFGCAIEEHSCYMGSGRIGVQVCRTNSRGYERSTCLSPWASENRRWEVSGCGETCEDLEAII